MRLLLVVMTCGIVTGGPVLGSVLAAGPLSPHHIHMQTAQVAPTLPSSQRMINLTEQDRHTIREIVLKDPKVKTEAQAVTEIGELVPPSIEIHEFPPLASEKIAALKSYRYFVVDGAVVIVETAERRIADVVKSKT